MRKYRYGQLIELIKLFVFLSVYHIILLFKLKSCSNLFFALSFIPQYVACVCRGREEACDRYIFERIAFWVFYSGISLHYNQMMENPRESCWLNLRIYTAIQTRATWHDEVCLCMRESRDCAAALNTHRFDDRCEKTLFTFSHDLTWLTIKSALAQDF